MQTLRAWIPLISLALLSQLPTQSLQAIGAFQIQLVNATFSPNADGLQDALQIQLQDVAGDLEEPYDWECEIQDAGGTRMRLFRADKRLIRQSASLGNLFMPGDRDVRPVQLFERLVWDGRDEKGQRVSDGYYKVVVRIFPQALGSATRAENNTIKVDTRAPELELRPVRSLAVFPGGQPDPSRSLELVQRVRNPESGTRFEARLFTVDGELLSTRVWNNTLPGRVVINWDELEKSGSPFTRYRYELTVVDAAGNRRVAELDQLIVCDYYPEAGLMPDRSHISPNGDGFGDVVQFQLGRYDSNGGFQKRVSASRWEFEILEEDGTTRLYHRGANGSPPASLYWDGRDYDRDYLSDGTYKARLILNGRRYSDLVPIIIKRETLSANLSLSASSFTPDGNGEEDYLDVELDVPRDALRWKLIVYLTPRVNAKEGAARPFRKIYRIYQGERGDQHSFVWDGSSDDGFQAQSLERFTFMYELVDRAGNHSVGQADVVRTGLFFRPFYKGGRNLVARIPLQGFFTEENKLSARGRAVLDEVQSELRWYGLYDFSIEVHASAPGREEKNLDRSEQRAVVIRQYLRAAGVQGDHVDYRGYGETELQRERNANFDHYRNERIEVRLTEGRR